MDYAPNVELEAIAEVVPSDDDHQVNTVAALIHTVSELVPDRQLICNNIEFVPAPHNSPPPPTHISTPPLPTPNSPDILFKLDTIAHG